MDGTYIFDLEEGRLCAEGEDLAGRGCEIILLSMEELKNLEGNYPHKRNLYRSMSPVQYCKIEIFEECTQGTMKVPHIKKGKIGVQTFGFYLRQDVLLLVEDGELVHTLLGKLAENAYGSCTPHQLLLLLFELLIDEDVIGLQRQEEKLAQMEEGLLKKMPDHFYETMIRSRSRISAYHVYYQQLVNIGDQMQSDFGQKLTWTERQAWQLYASRAERLRNHVELLREYLVQIRELYQSRIDEQQNKVMSILTVVTTIFLPLTLIAGWYGMNFPNMPELGWKYAYPAVLLVSVGITVLEVLFFRKKKML